MNDSMDLMKFVSDGVDHAKAGRGVEIYRKILPYFNSGSLSLKSHYAFGWIVYYALHQSGDANPDERKQMLATYLKLKVARPHKLHSMILTEAIRLYRNLSRADYAKKNSAQKEESLAHFSIVKFMDLWKFENLREGDWRRKPIEGNITPSTTEKLITHYIDELTGEEGQSASEEFHKILEKALAEYPDSATLLGQYAALGRKEGENEKAIDYLRKAILISPAKAYLWQRLAEALPEEGNTRLRIALLYRALCAPGSENFKGRIRIALAKEMISAGAASQGLWELERVEKIYTANGWNMPGDYRKLKGMIPEETIAADPSAAYRKIAHLAEEFLYEALPQTEASKSFHRPADPTAIDRNGRPKPRPTAWRVTDAAGSNFWFNPGRHNIPEELPHGTRVFIRVIGNKVVDVTLKAEE